MSCLDCMCGLPCDCEDRTVHIRGSVVDHEVLRSYLDFDDAVYATAMAKAAEGPTKHKKSIKEVALNLLPAFLNFMVARPGKKRVVNHVVPGLNLHEDGRPVLYRFTDPNTGETKETSNYREALAAMPPAVPDSVEKDDQGGMVGSFYEVSQPTPTPPIGVSGVTGMTGPVGLTGAVGATMAYPGPFLPHIEEFTERRLNGILQVFYQDRWWPKNQLEPRVFPPKKAT